MGAFTRILSLLFLSLATLCITAKPTITPFQNLPAKLFYFDDTTVVLYHDPVERNVYISDDEGKNWRRASTVPEGEALVLVEHPFDNRMAFILTRGTKHYRTTDRGKLWQSFDVEVSLSITSTPLSFHADKTKGGLILYQGTKCKIAFPWGRECEDQTYYTTDGFISSTLLLERTSQCTFAHSTRQIPATTPSDLIFCVAFDASATDGMNSLSSSRLFSSTDFFQKDKKIVDFGLKNAKASRGVIALGVVSKFLVAAVKDLVSSHSGPGPAAGAAAEMKLYVSVDGENWSHAKFPHASSSKLLENAYTIVESTTHSLAIDVLSHASPRASIGTLFVSNSNGTYFVESLQNTNRNEAGFVDFEDVVGVEGVGISNIVDNPDEVEGRDATKKVKSVITFDDGRTWTPVAAPDADLDDKKFLCTPSINADSKCSLHLYSVTMPHNIGRIFSTKAPGFILGVGSVGPYLLPYDECDTFLSTDAGVSWHMVSRGAHKYEIGDLGSFIVLVDDEESTDFVKYSFDEGKTWQNYDLGVKMRARLLTTIPDSTSQKFILLGTLSRSDAESVGGRHALTFLDFAELGKKVCDKDKDMEKWYARTSSGKECLMGHKQWYWRRKADADCVVGHKFDDPVEHEENCACTDEDYECDYNFVRQNGKCVAAGPEDVAEGQCPGKQANEQYSGSSGYRLIPGNTCVRDPKNALDNPVQKDCSKARPPEGNATHQIFEFDSPVDGHWYFRKSKTILVHLRDGSVWQSANEGYSWAQPRPDEKFLAVYMHAYSNDRAYLFTQNKIYITTDTGRLWTSLDLPMAPNIMGLPLLYTHPLQSDWLIYIGSEGCSPMADCKAVAHYSKDHARSWQSFETYVRSCGWARDNELRLDAKLILCETYRDKKGSQLMFGGMNPLELWLGSDFYSQRKKLFNSVVGHAKFSEYVIVGEVGKNSLDLQVSLDGQHYAKGLFPPSMRLDNHAYTVLESSTDSVFLHLTMSSARDAEWGNLLKSNSNGTYYGLSLEFANRNERGYVDFEKMIGLDGIAVVNIVANAHDAAVSHKKDIQTRITHNDGGTWKPMTPPALDSLGQPYSCQGVKCSLHIHGYTERIDARATYSSPSAIGLMMAVGNVGEKLAAYQDSDTFLTRDGGFTWEEVRKDAHMYEFGDSGSVLVLANDEGPTDHVIYSTDEGLSWKEYGIGTSVRVRSIVTVTAETSRKFILFGVLSSGKAVAVHLDFSGLTNRQCELKINDPANDDFELWSPSEEREERCLFGRQVLYHRRIRDRNCYVGDQEKIAEKLVKNCECIASDFECEFNHVRNSAGECVLAEGATPLSLSTEETCITDPDSEFWYERTAYRKIPHSTCEGGNRLDRGPQHSCGGLKGRSALFWWSIVLLPFAFTALIAYSFYRRGGLRQTGAIRLPESIGRGSNDDSGLLSTLASVPYFIVGIGAVAWNWFSNLPVWGHRIFAFRQRGGYRHVPVDEDARVLRFEDED